MGFLDKLKKKLEEARVTTTPQRAPTRHGRYESLAAWIKTKYGKRFREGSTSAEVETHLENIFRELEAQGAFRKHPKIANGFRAYISERQYGDLVRVID